MFFAASTALFIRPTLKYRSRRTLMFLRYCTVVLYHTPDGVYFSIFCPVISSSWALFMGDPLSTGWTQGSRGNLSILVCRWLTNVVWVMVQCCGVIAADRYLGARSLVDRKSYTEQFVSGVYVSPRILSLSSQISFP